MDLVHGVDLAEAAAPLPATKFTASTPPTKSTVSATSLAFEE